MAAAGTGEFATLRENVIALFDRYRRETADTRNALTIAKYAIASNVIKAITFVENVADLKKILAFAAITNDRVTHYHKENEAANTANELTNVRLLARFKERKTLKTNKVAKFKGLFTSQPAYSGYHYDGRLGAALLNAEELVPTHSGVSNGGTATPELTTLGVTGDRVAQLIEVGLDSDKIKTALLNTFGGLLGIDLAEAIRRHSTEVSALHALQIYNRGAEYSRSGSVHSSGPFMASETQFLRGADFYKAHLTENLIAFLQSDPKPTPQQESMAYTIAHVINILVYIIHGEAEETPIDLEALATLVHTVEYGRLGRILMNLTGGHLPTVEAAQAAIQHIVSELGSTSDNANVKPTPNEICTAIFASARFDLRKDPADFTYAFNQFFHDLPGLDTAIAPATRSGSGQAAGWGGGGSSGYGSGGHAAADTTTPFATTSIPPDLRAAISQLNGYIKTDDDTSAVEDPVPYYKNMLAMKLRDFLCGAPAPSLNPVKTAFVIAHTINILIHCLQQQELNQRTKIPSDRERLITLIQTKHFGSLGKILRKKLPLAQLSTDSVSTAIDYLSAKANCEAATATPQQLYEAVLKRDNDFSQFFKGMPTLIAVVPPETIEEGDEESDDEESTDDSNGASATAASSNSYAANLFGTTNTTHTVLNAGGASGQTPSEECHG